MRDRDKKNLKYNKILFIFLTLFITTNVFFSAYASVKSKTYDGEKVYYSSYNKETYFDTREEAKEYDEELKDDGSSDNSSESEKTKANVIDEFIKDKSNMIFSKPDFGLGFTVDSMFLKNVLYLEEDQPYLKTISNSLSKYLKTIALSIIVLYALWCGFKIYILWKDGSPDENPKEMVTRIAVAIAFLLSFDEVLKITTEIVANVIRQILAILSTTSVPKLTLIEQLGTLNPVDVFVGVICSIIYFYQYLKMIFNTLKMGVELYVLKLGLPLACVNLVSSHSNTWSSYITTILKDYAGICVNVLIMGIGCKIYDSSGSSGNRMLWAAAFLAFANGSKEILSQFITASRSNVSGGQVMGMAGQFGRTVGQIGKTIVTKTSPTP